MPVHMISGPVFPVTWLGYCLLCDHCGRIERYLYGARPQVRRCKSCGRDMIVCGCIVTHTEMQYDLNGLPTLADDVKPSAPES